MTLTLRVLGQRIRRDGTQILLWALGTGALAALAVVGVRTAFGTTAARHELIAAAIANPIIMLFRGLPSGTDEGAVLAFLILPFLAILAGFMSVFAAVRHTRGDEEAGRAEAVAATPASRTIPLVATILHGILANTLLAAVVVVAFLAAGLDGGGALVAGLAVGATGLAYFGVALLAAQLFRTSRGANTVSVWILLVTFLLCGIGNALGTPSPDLQRVESAPLTWVSPFGWAENTRAFDADDLRPLLLSVALLVAATILAVVLQSARDLGSGLLPESRGRLQAARTLAGPLGLSWRLSRGAVAGWAAGGFVVGLLATRLAPILDSVGDEIPAIQQAVSSLSATGSLAQGAIALFYTVVGILAASAAVQAIARARQEEVRGTAEPVLASAVDRVRWLTGYGVVGLAGIAAAALAAVAGSTLGIATVSDPDWSLWRHAVVAAAGQLPAGTVFLALTALVFVLLPRLTVVLGWLLVLVAAVVGLFGALLGFPDWIVDASPFAATPIATADGVDVRGLGGLLLVTIAAGLLAAVLMRRRELVPAG